MYTVETIPSTRIREHFRDETARFAFDYWDRIRRNSNVPDRRDIEPADMAPVLGNLLLLETFAGSVSFRLGGSQLTAHLRRETRGTSAATIWRGMDRGRFEALIHTLVDLPGGALLTADLMIDGRSPTPFEILLLPLTFRSKEITRFLGTATPLRNDYWLGTESPLGFELRNIVLFEATANRDSSTTPSESNPIRVHRHLAVYAGGQER
ncbi:MAG: PAS domain-containing protein [Pseudomonadota bacterium]